jgi:hypothetical protein
MSRCTIRPCSRLINHAAGEDETDIGNGISLYNTVLLLPTIPL